MASPPVLQLLQVVENRLAGPQHAERSVAKAAHAIDAAAAANRSLRVPANLDPQTILALANRFIETGQLPNYIRAPELDQVIQSWYDEELPAVSARELQSRSRCREALRGLWRRTPLLVLLVGWMAAGIVTEVFLKTLHIPNYETSWAFNLWAVGFLGMVVFQFVVVTIRGAPK